MTGNVNKSVSYNQIVIVAGVATAKLLSAASVWLMDNCTKTRTINDRKSGVQSKPESLSHPLLSKSQYSSHTQAKSIGTKQPVSFQENLLIPTKQSEVLNLSDTLSVTLTRPIEHSTSDRYKTAFKQIMLLATRHDFNLQVNMPAEMLKSTESIYRKSYGLERDKNFSYANTISLRKSGNKGVIKFVTYDKKSIDWSEKLDSSTNISNYFFINQLHKKLEEKSILDAIDERRTTAWRSLGIVEKERVLNLSHFMKYSDSAENIANKPSTSRFFKTKKEDKNLCSTTNKHTLDTEVYGRNFLSNGTEPGNRKFIIGLDTIAIFRKYFQGEAIGMTDDEVKNHIKKQMGLQRGDQVAFVEQPAQYIDMVINIIGNNEVILNSPKMIYETQKSKYSTNKSIHTLYFDLQRLCDDTKKRLEAIGFTVYEKPWIDFSVKNNGPHLLTISSIAFNFMNGEYVKTQNNEKLFITDGFYDQRLSFPNTEACDIALEKEVSDFFNERGIKVVCLPRREAITLLGNM